MLTDKQDTEILLLRLIIDGYLKESFVTTAYARNGQQLPVGCPHTDLGSAYVTIGKGAARLTRFEEAQLADSGLKIELTTLGLPKKGKKRAGKQKDVDSEMSAQEEAGTTKPKKKSVTKKQKTGEPVNRVIKSGDGATQASRMIEDMRRKREAQRTSSDADGIPAENGGWKDAWQEESDEDV